MPKLKESQESLKGWTAVAKFLSQPVSTAQRWANEGMPVTRIGRYVAASPAELERWLTREAGAKAVCSKGFGGHRSQAHAALRHRARAKHLVQDSEPGIFTEGR